jgi:hypothetical protein
MRKPTSGGEVSLQGSSRTETGSEPTARRTEVGLWHGIRRSRRGRQGARRWGATMGRDVGDRHSSFCVPDAAGEIVEEGRGATTPEALTRCFRGAAMRVALMRVALMRVALETGGGHALALGEPPGRRARARGDRRQCAARAAHQRERLEVGSRTGSTPSPWPVRAGSTRRSSRPCGTATPQRRRPSPCSARGTPSCARARCSSITCAARSRQKGKAGGGRLPTCSTHNVLDPQRARPTASRRRRPSRPSTSRRRSARRSGRCSRPAAPSATSGAPMTGR